MDFWEAQRRARKKTSLFLAIFIALTLIVAFLVELFIRVSIPGEYHPQFPIVGPLFLLVTFAVAFFQYSMYSRYGGSYVAESVGAYRVPYETNDLTLRQLRNIVEEMALASHLPVPEIYVMDAKEINAFAAGLTPDKAVIAVTQGALQKLNRDELQGVIAHEFGHIKNGDMRINLSLAAMVMGFFFILYLGLRTLQFSSFRRGGDRKGGNPVILAALAFFIAGIFTWFFGSLLKAMVSRQREYLADASSVQYTRNPGGIANALRKIGKDQVKDMPPSGMAYSHMYFDNRSFLSALFATHPPLEKRIDAIENRKE